MIKKLNIKSFGAIKDKEINFGKNLNIIYGDNEAGKTTVHEALRSLMFGFSPAKLENHSYKPWDGSKIFLEGDIEAKNNISVARKLAERPEGNIMYDGIIKAISNKALESVDHISKDVFRQIYAVTLDDMNNLSSKSMELVFDGLVENYGLDFINSPSEVIKDIQSKEDEIYRENRRGKYRIKEIDEEMKSIKIEIRESEESVDEYFKSKLKLEVIEDIKNDKVGELKKIKHEDDSISSLMDIVKQKKYLGDLRLSINFESHSFKTLFDNIRSVKELEQDILNKENNLIILKDDIDKEASNIDVLDESEKNILNRRPKHIIAKNYVTKINQIIQDIEYKKTILFDHLSSRRNLEKKLFSKELKSVEISSLEKLDVLSLKRYIEDEYDNRDKGKEKSIYKSLILPLIITVFIALAFYFNYMQLVFVASIILSALFMKVYKDHTSDVSNADLYDKRLELLLGDLPVPRIYVEEVDNDYFENIFKLREIQIKISAIESELKALDDSKKEIWEKIIIKLEDTRLLSDDVNIQILNTVLEEFSLNVEEIKLKELRKKSKEDRIDELKNRYELQLDEIDKLISDRKSKFNYINNTFGINNEDFKSLMKDELKVDKACEIELALSNEIDMTSKTNEIEVLENSGAEFSSKYLLELRVRSNDIMDELKSMENNIGTLSEKIKNLYSVDKRDDLFSSLKRLKTEREELMVKRAILSTTRENISSFDKAFRDENQPDILKNTSDYFTLITDNKYEKVYMQSETNKLILRSEFGEKSIDDGFSRGTKEQLYFCFRLAIIKHLCDEKKQNLPIILDDVFVNWDFNRIKNLKKLIIEVAKERQVIIFTCHKSQLEIFGDEELINTVIL